MLYQIKHSDGSIFLGGNVYDSKWKEIKKPIEELIYTFQNQTIRLKNFESYNHLIFKKNNMQTGSMKISGILLIAKDKNIVHCFLFNKKEKKLSHYISEYTKKFQPPQMTGWKTGIPSEKPSFTIL